MNLCVHKLSVTALSLGGALSAFALVLTGSGTAAGQSSRDGAQGATSVGVGAAPLPGRVRLHYDLGPGTHGCDDEAFFRRLLRSELEIPDPFEPTSSATHTLTVRIERDDPGFRAIVKLHTVAGQEVYARDFLERSCSDAVDRAVIVSMIAVFPAADDNPSPPPPPPPAEPPASAREEGSALEERVTALEERVAAQERAIQELTDRLHPPEKKLHHEEKGTKKRMDIAWALSAGALMTANLTPDVAPGAWMEVQARTGPFSLSANLRSAFPSQVVYSTYHFDLSEFTGFLVPCGHYSYFSGCGLIGVGFDYLYVGDAFPSTPANMARASVQHIFQAGARISAEVPFGETRFGAKAWAEVLYGWPTLSADFADDPKQWFRQPVTAMFGLGLTFKLGEEGVK